MSYADEFADGAAWRSVFRDPSYVRGECPIFVSLMKALAKSTQDVEDPEDWALHLGRLVRQLPAIDADRLPRELGFLVGLGLSSEATLKLYGACGLPEAVLTAAGDRPATVLDVISYALEASRVAAH